MHGAPGQELREDADARAPLLLRQLLQGGASAEDEALFRTLWQDRVRRLLLEHADDPRVIDVERVQHR